MRNLFRSGTAFLMVSGISFLAAAIIVAKRLVTGDGSTAIAGASIGSAVVWFVIGLAVRSKNTK
jgi:xanthine/uracil permease